LAACRQTVTIEDVHLGRESGPEYLLVFDVLTDTHLDLDD
jgi:hypothetical protein